MAGNRGRRWLVSSGIVVALAGAVVLPGVPWWMPGGASCAARDALQPTVAASLSGEVIDTHGAPVANARIVVSDALGDQEAHTAEDGSYRVARRPSGRVRIEVEVGGAVVLRLREFFVVEPLVLAIGAPFEQPAIAGLPVGPRALTQPEKRLRIEFAGDVPEAEGPLVVRYSSGALAEYRVVAPAVDGGLDIEAPAEGCALDFATRSLVSACTWESRDPLQLEPPTVVTGCVVDRWGRAVPGAVVTATPDGAVPPFPSLAFTDRQGRFRVAACPHVCVVRARHVEKGIGGVFALRPKERVDPHVHIVVR